MRKELCGMCWGEGVDVEKLVTGWKGKEGYGG
jgi:hypothetical protein